MEDLYYKPNQLWTGRKTIRKLYEITWIPCKKVNQWLAKQTLWQVHVPIPKQVNKAHFPVKVPNQQHQFDVLNMPHDKFQGSVYKYILIDVDVSSRYKVAKPLRTRKQVT